jgi:hypothetical protein
MGGPGCYRSAARKAFACPEPGGGVGSVELLVDDRSVLLAADDEPLRGAAEK